jgi:hypothetical protein
MSISELTAVAALLLNVTVAVVGLTWGLGKIRDTVRDEIDEHRKDFDGAILSLRREVGETALALRQKVTEVELWGRDNFVKKDSFGIVTDRISQEVKDFAERIDRRLERMEGKIDHGA